MKKLIAFCILLGVISVLADTKTAVQGTNKWSNSQSWIPVGVPGYNDTVIIGSGSTILFDTISARFDKQFHSINL